jgi:hypothetical protein
MPVGCGTVSNSRCPANEWPGLRNMSFSVARVLDNHSESKAELDMTDIEKLTLN